MAAKRKKEEEKFRYILIEFDKRENEYSGISEIEWYYGKALKDEIIELTYSEYDLLSQYYYTQNVRLVRLADRQTYDPLADIPLALKYAEEQKQKEEERKRKRKEAAEQRKKAKLEREKKKKQMKIEEAVKVLQESGIVDPSDIKLK